jgi:hypothetical protein
MQIWTASLVVAGYFIAIICLAGLIGLCLEHIDREKK